MAAPSKPSFFLNITTTNAPAAASFYTALNFTPVAAYSDDSTKTFTLPAPNQNICLMIHVHDRFKSFMRSGDDIPDPLKTTQALFSMSVDTQAKVDEWLDKAHGAGGKKDPYVMEGYGKDCGMYSRSFTDVDGHIWEVLYDLPKEEAKE